MTDEITIIVEEPAPIIIEVGEVIVTGGGGGGAVDSVNGATGVVVLDQDDVLDGTTFKQYSQTEKTKLAGIATGATANSADATLLARANHTGTQSADTLTDGTTNKAFLATERTKLAGIATAATANSSDATLLARANHTGTQASTTISDFEEAVEDLIGANVAGTGLVSASYNDTSGVTTISTTATANSSDATLLNRTNHTGTQTASTISDFDTAADVRVNAARGLYVGVNAQTGTTYAPVLGDVGKFVTLSNAGAITVTMPSDATTAFATGTQIDFAVIGAGMATFVAGSSATVNGTPSAVTRAQYSAVTAIKYASNTWLIVGDTA